MQVKTTTKLFKGLYQYKIVLVCPGAHWFRGSMEEALEHLEKVDLTKTNNATYRNTFIKTQDQLDYAFKLQNQLSVMKAVDIRVESPWISIYTNNRKDINALIKLEPNNVKYISEPAGNLASGTIVMPKMNYDYRVTLGKTNQVHTAFIEWAENSSKCKLTKSCIRDLQKTRSWGGTHFYVTGENNLLMVKMHLGGSISKLERIVKN
jgi:hypothetical protein